MMGKIRRKLERLSQYPGKIDGLGAYLCIFDELLGREVVRSIAINGNQIYVRTNTPDIDVAVSSLCDKEYDHICLTAPRVIIDAGANIGTSSIFFAKKYPGAHIFAVEPEAGNFELLKKNTQKYPNIVPIRAAIWGNDCTRTIKNRFTGHWGYTVSETTNRTESTGQEIHCVTINSLMKEHGIEAVDLLKMDIEGGEKDVLENSQGWIGSVDTMTVELHDRICIGCETAFQFATKDFEKFEKHGEKVTAYRR